MVRLISFETGKLDIIKIRLLKTCLSQASFEDMFDFVFQRVWLHIIVWALFLFFCEWHLGKLSKN